MHETVAGIFSISLIVLGLSYLLRTHAWVNLYREFEAYPRRFIPTALLIFVSGLALAISFNDWTSTWPIFITSFGWLMALEAGLLLFKPALVGGVTRLVGRRLIVYLRLGGLLLLGLGCLLAWEYLLEARF